MGVINPFPITLKPLDGKQIGKYCKKLSNEIGLVLRQCAPVIVEKWKQMPQFEINIMLDLIKVKLLQEQLYNHFRNGRCDLHKHVKKFPTMIEAKCNP